MKSIACLVLASLAAILTGCVTTGTPPQVRDYPGFTRYTQFGYPLYCHIPDRIPCFTQGQLNQPDFGSEADAPLGINTSTSPLTTGIPSSR
jgi:hypothetical protein